LTGNSPTGWGGPIVGGKKKGVSTPKRKRTGGGVASFVGRLLPWGQGQNAASVGYREGEKKGGDALTHAGETLREKPRLWA